MSLEVDIDHARGSFQLAARFAAAPGLTALFGRSGSGKTTLVDIVGGLIRPDRGRVAVDGQVLVDTERGVFVPKHRRRIGYVFQDSRLFPHLSVRQQPALRPLVLARADGGAAADLASVVELLGIGHLLERRPASLSGGEKQRVAIGRALLAHPRLLLMDEPLASLDEARRAEILPYIERLRDESGRADPLCQPLRRRGGAACHHGGDPDRRQGDGRRPGRRHPAAGRCGRRRQRARCHGGAPRRGLPALRR